MSLRDYFAATALAGLMTEPQWNRVIYSILSKVDAGGEGDNIEDRLARASMRIANAMLKAREVNSD
jgi:hypothetical protein